MVVCGDSPLAHRLVDELSSKYGEYVTAIVPSKRRSHGQQIDRLAGVRVIESAELDDEAFQAAQVSQARALALVGEGDVTNIHAALRAQELNPDLRLVIRITNTSLGRRLRQMFADCALLSDAGMAAPAFVAAALGELTPTHVRLPGRTLRVARRSSVPASHIICGLADTTGAGGPHLLPIDQANADLVLSVADGTPSEPTPRRRERPAWPRLLLTWLAALVNRKLRIALFALLGLLVLTTLMFATAGHYTWTDAIYLTLLDAAGAAQPETTLSPVNKIGQVLVTVVGIALIPVVTAAVVDAVVGARLAGADVRLRRPVHDHVVVVGLGNVGGRVVSQLHDLGVPVICVERDEKAPGVATARQIGLPIVFGNANRMETLRSAHIGTSRAMLALTSDDVTNLEVALHARAVAPELRVAMRVFDSDFAERIQRNFGINSRSVSFLAAPAFAAAMVERQVIDTIPVERTVLLVADVRVAAGSRLPGARVEEVHQPGEARVIALRRRDSEHLEWSPPTDYRLCPEDRMVVLATRTGLGRIFARSIGPNGSSTA
jgi:Trk K+ transport system NAD-binding subunit